MQRAGWIVGAVLAVGAVSAAGGSPLDAARWRSRVLVVAAAHAEDPALSAQRAAVEAARGGFTERDLVVIEAVGPGAQVRALRNRLALPGSGFHAVLVGKDGGVKLRSDRPIAAEQLFETIDAMPMRRDEMRGRR